MKSKAKNVRLQRLSISIGHFIRYWGFRRIHGAIWAQLYLSKTPLSCTDLSQRLGLSKALISPALDELVKHQLIAEAPSPNDKTKLYTASENINDVIRHVLKTREALMLKEITENFSSFETTADADQNLDQTRVKKLGEMILAANLMLELMLSQDDIMKMPMELDL
jgi:DNA-binding transcriptional regulator GbsR (MarR family)